MLLQKFTKHPFRSTADHIFKSVLCGRCGTVNYHPLLNIYDFKAFGGWSAKLINNRPGLLQALPHRILHGSPKPQASRRKWCVGEMCTARSHGVNTVTWL